jgi:opacity protein-like surface antigen
MKKLFLFVLAVSLLASSVASARPKFGLKAGLNIASASISPLGDGVSKKSILGFLAGGTIEAPLSEDQSFGLRGEVTWTEKGAKISGDNGFMTGTYDELDFSPFLVYNISGLMEGARPFIQAGPELGFVIGTNQHTEIDNAGTKDESIKDAASTDFSLNFGAGVGLPLNNKGEVVFDARYCLGLTDMDDTSELTVKLHSFLINVGYNFPPKK